MIILTADIGGTNTSIALIEHTKGHFELLALEMYVTHELSNFSQALEQALKAFSRRGAAISAACLSIAGPINDKRCVPTNIPWILDGYEIERDFGFPTTVINDFTAICYGIPLVNIDDPKNVHPLPHPDGTIPEQQDYLAGISVKAVIGAGTGLGLGYLIEEADRVLAMPAEGGHSDFAPHNQSGREVARYLEKHFGSPLNVEHVLSGQGIANIFRFMRDEKGADSPAVRRIDSLSDPEKPSAISRAARATATTGGDETCEDIMTLFVEIYARKAHNVALSFIPKKGLFLAGGIAAKNRDFFLKDNLFMKTFLHNINSPVRPLLSEIPVYILEDYRISLYGAAHAFLQLQKLKQ